MWWFMIYYLYMATYITLDGKWCFPPLHCSGKEGMLNTLHRGTELRKSPNILAFLKGLKTWLYSLAWGTQAHTDMGPFGPMRPSPLPVLRTANHVYVYVYNLILFLMLNFMDQIVHHPAFLSKGDWQ